jgi:hypothetical protein
MNRPVRIALTLGWFSLPLVYYAVKGYLYLPACGIQKVFGIPCPGCGVRRGLDYALQADIISALKAYPPLGGLTLLFIALGICIATNGKSLLCRQNVLMILFFIIAASMALFWAYQLAGF